MATVSFSDGPFACTVSQTQRIHLESDGKSLYQGFTFAKDYFVFKRALLIAAFATAPAYADPARINSVIVTKSGGLYNFDVTVSHPDTGWEHHVDAWRIKDEEGNLLGTRSLAHPHVDEQPFTRSLSGVEIPEGVEVVFIDAHDTLSGWGPDLKRVSLP